MTTASIRADAEYPQVRSGFNFENARRNAVLEKTGMKMPTAHKTGTTICGVVFEGGVVLGADTRATSNLVVDKNCEKIHYIAPNMYCCGAGTAADTEATTGQISSQLALLRLNLGTQSRVVTAVTMLKQHLFNYQGQVSAALVLGGVDHDGGHLHTIYPHGSTDSLPFVTMGSGSLAAMSVFESSYKDDLNEAEAMDMVRRAIRAGIFNDLGSGSNVDLCIIRANDDVTYLRNYETPNDQKSLRTNIKTPATAFNFPVGTTPVVSETRRQLG